MLKKTWKPAKNIIILWDPNTDPIYIYNSNFFHSTTWQARTFFCLGHVVTLWQKLLRQNYRTFLKLPNNFWLDQIIGSMIRHRNIDKKAQIRAVLAPGKTSLLQTGSSRVQHHKNTQRMTKSFAIVFSRN